MSNIKGTPDAESTRVPVVALTVRKSENKGQTSTKIVEPLKENAEQEIEDEQWGFIWDEVKKMKETKESVQIESQRRKEEQEQVKKQRALIEAQEEQRLQEQRGRTQDSISRAKRGLEEL